MNRGNIQGDGIYHQRFLQTGVDFSQVSLRDHKSTFELVVNSPLFSQATDQEVGNTAKWSLAVM